MGSLARISSDSAGAWFGDQAAALALAACPRERQPLLIERSAAAGHMAPLHRRHEVEVYRVVEGDVSFFVGADVIEARAGDVVTAPAGAERTFRVESKSARWTVVTRVASLERFVDFGRAVSPPVAAPAAGWPSASEFAALAATAAANGIVLTGPPGALPSGH